MAKKVKEKPTQSTNIDLDNEIIIGIKTNKVLDNIFAESLRVAYSSSTFIISNLLLSFNI